MPADLAAAPPPHPGQPRPLTGPAAWATTARLPRLPTASESPTGSRRTRDGRRGLPVPRASLFTEALGTAGPTLVFLPGLGGTTRYWRSRVMPLADTHRLVLVDMLGFGRSPKPWTTYSVGRHVAELHRVLAEHGPLTLVGHSFGATVALAYTAQYPAQVRRLVLVSVPYYGSMERARQHFRAGRSLEGYVATNILLAVVACVVTRRVLGRALPFLMRNLPREVAEDLVQHTWRSSTSTLWEGIYHHDPAASAARLPVGLPVLLLHGEHDATAPLPGAEQLAAILPTADLQVLPRVDHHPLLRAPAWCLTALRAFLAAETSSARAA